MIFRGCCYNYAAPSGAVPSGPRVSIVGTTGQLRSGIVVEQHAPRNPFSAPSGAASAWDLDVVVGVGVCHAGTIPLLTELGNDFSRLFLQLCRP